MVSCTPLVNRSGHFIEPYDQGMTPSASPDSEAGDALRHPARDPHLMVWRAETAATGAQTLRKAGQVAHVVGHLIGDGRTSGSSTRGNGDDALVGVGVLTQIAADLLEAAGALLSGENHYAGAALLRQVVEVEYLTWAFANQKRDAAMWLNSDQETRRRMFTPARLRSESDGRFLSADYGHHCEQGGHPVPRAIPLLGNSDPVHSQLLLVDLLLHAWRTTDNVFCWADDTGPAALTQELAGAQQAFAAWGATDPLYQWAVNQGDADGQVPL